MKKIRLKIFILPNLTISEIKRYVQSNYSSFSYIHLDFEYNAHTDRWILIVDLSPDRLSSFIVSLRSFWLSSSDFNEDYHQIRRFLNHIDELPF